MVSKPTVRRTLSIFLVSLFLSPALLANNQLEEPSPRDRATPIIIQNPNNPDEARVGVITVEPQQQRRDAISVLRRELRRLAEAEQAQIRRDGVFWSTTKRFAPESLAFFIAIGAVTYNSMWIKSHGDPLQMQRHIDSLRDPIAHLSFFAFMQTQGFYMDIRSRGLGVAAMDPTSRAQTMRRLSYQGMAVGSLASSLVSDIGHSIKACTDRWLEGRTDERSLAVCDQAWAEWTARDKFVQYFPMILNMWASQAATELLEATTAAAFDRVSTSGFARGLLANNHLMRMAYKITAADVVLTFVGGGWFTKTIKFVGKVTRFSLFVGIDQFLSNYTYRPVNNIIQPLFFNGDALAVVGKWDQADRINWTFNQHESSRTLVSHFERDLKNFSKRMQQWRDHLNREGETDINGWLEMTRKILNQIDYSYRFYKEFVSYFVETIKTNRDVRAGNRNAEELQAISGYPFRSLPLFGVAAGLAETSELQLNDLYIAAPRQMQELQKNYAVSVTAPFRNRERSLRMRDAEKTEFRGIVDNILTGDPMRMALGLQTMNRTLDIHYLSMQLSPEAGSPSSGAYIDLLESLKQNLGNPRPVTEPLAGFAQAFAVNSVSQIIAENADFSTWSLFQGYSYTNTTDMLMAKMLCGQRDSQLHRTRVAGVTLTQPQFEPPTLLTGSSDRTEYCRSISTNSTLYRSNVGSSTLSQFVTRSMTPGAYGNFDQIERTAQVFDRWWTTYAKRPINGEFREFDNKFKRAFQTVYDSFFDRRNLFQRIVDHLNQSKYLSRSLKGSLKTEAYVYLEILNRSLLTGNVQLPEKPVRLVPSPSIYDLNRIREGRTAYEDPNYYDYVENAKEMAESQSGGFTSPYNEMTPEVRELQQLISNYIRHIQNDDLNFDAYIATAKRFDTLLNDAKVRAGLKRLVQVSQSDDLTGASESGSENTSSIYEDIPVANKTFKQRMTIAAIEGLETVEAELRRFVRMRAALDQQLELDNAEFTGANQ